MFIFNPQDDFSKKGLNEFLTHKNAEVPLTAAEIQQQEEVFH